MPRETYKTLSTLILVTCLLNFCVCTNHDTRVTGASKGGEQEIDSSKPKDYAYSSNNSRVKSLVNFFEKLNNDNNYNSNAQTRSQQDLVISLPEAASKLHVLSDGFLLEVKCNKYVKLIEQPDIRTFDTVNQLVAEKRLAIEAEQIDANLMAKLLNERKFDPLGKIQTILQSFEAEKSNQKSNYKSSVKKDLLDCLNYYIYRHQRATGGLIDYVRENLENLRQEDESEINLRKMKEVVKRIESIESDQKDDVTAWLRELTKLHELVIENNNMIPHKILNFVTEPDRLNRLAAYNQVLNLADELKGRSSSMESDEPVIKLRNNAVYKKTLVELNELLESHQDLLPVDVYNYVHQPERWQLIQDNEKENQLNGGGGGMSDQKALEESCRDMAMNLMESLRLFNWQLTNQDEASSLSLNLNYYLDECYGVEGSVELSKLTRQTRWPIMSLTRKLSAWCLKILKDSASNSKLEDDRQCLLSVLEVLDKIKAKDNPSAKTNIRDL